MKTVVIGLQKNDDLLADFAAAWKDRRADTSAHIGFASWDLMHKVLSPKRLDILRAMTGAGPLAMREIARRVGRDFKGVHTDATMLLNAGLIDKNDDGKLVFPYDTVKVDFEFTAAA